jgi:hypothetical protein
MDTWSMRIQQWRNESPAKGANETAQRLLDQIDTPILLSELEYYMASLYNNDGPNMIQAKRAEGPEDFHVLLSSVETMKRYKARIRAIGLSASKYVRHADELYDLIKKTLQLRPEFQELRTADMRESTVRLVARELVELKSKLEEVVEASKEVSNAYSDYFNAAALEYNIVNSMSYYRGLYDAGSARTNSGPRKF